MCPDEYLRDHLPKCTPQPLPPQESRSLTDSETLHQGEGGRGETGKGLAECLAQDFALVNAPFSQNYSGDGGEKQRGGRKVATKAQYL